MLRATWYEGTAQLLSLNCIDLNFVLLAQPAEERQDRGHHDIYCNGWLVSHTLSHYPTHATCPGNSAKIPHINTTDRQVHLQDVCMFSCSQHSLQQHTESLSHTRNLPSGQSKDPIANNNHISTTDKHVHLQEMCMFSCSQHSLQQHTESLCHTRNLPSGQSEDPIANNNHISTTDKHVHLQEVCMFGCPQHSL